MKRFLLTITAVAVFACCNKVQPSDSWQEEEGYNFNFNIGGGGFTKADATVGWTEGEKVFIFFAPEGELLTDCCLTLQATSGGWKQVGPYIPYGKLGSNGKLSAVYVPYLSSNAAPVYADDRWTIDGGDVYYSCAAGVDYNVKGSDVNANIQMAIPDGYVQFRIGAEIAADGDILACNIVDAFDCVSLGPDMNFSEIAVPDKTMTGHQDGSGVFFFGKANDSGEYSCNWTLSSPSKTLTKCVLASKVEKNKAYNLDFSMLKVEGEALTSYKGGSKQLSVYSSSSWKLQYQAEGSSDWTDASAGETVDGWVSFSKVSGDAFSNDEVNVTMAGAESETTVEYIVNHDKNLQEAAPRGTELEPWDLSMHDIYGNVNPAGMTTANSYVISAPGWYSFPVVYGNAIKNGTVNTGAFRPTAGAAGNNYLTPFKDSQNAGITGPYISNVASAKILWENTAGWTPVPQDACKLVGSGENARILLHVPAENLAPCNLVIAACNASGYTIYWSWHIWITDADLTTVPVVNAYGQNFEVMPQLFGWLENNLKRTTVGHPGKKLKIRIVSMEGGSISAIEERIVRREEFIEDPSLNTINGRAVYYQWGRKDPFLTAYSGKNRAKLSISNSYTLASGIGAPTTFFYDNKQYGKWYVENNTPNIHYSNLWNADCTVFRDVTTALGNCTKPVKTIYDPCPPGFQVPQPDAFTSFTTATGAPNAVGSFNGYGYNLRTGVGDNTIFVPIDGCISGYDNYAGPDRAKEWGFLLTSDTTTKSINGDVERCNLCYKMYHYRPSGAQPMKEEVSFGTCQSTQGSSILPVRE